MMSWSRYTGSKGAFAEAERSLREVGMILEESGDGGLYVRFDPAAWSQAHEFTGAFMDDLEEAVREGREMAREGHNSFKERGYDDLRSRAFYDVWDRGT